MVLRLPEDEKRFFWGSNVIFFIFFVNFWGTKLKPFSRKANRSLQNGFILKFARQSILEIDFEATLKSKTNFLSVWKWIYIYIYIFFFCTFFSEQVENVLAESRAKYTKLCKFEVGHSIHFRKWFWNYLEVKSRCTTEPLKKTHFSFLHIFEWRSWNNFQEKWGKAFKTI